MDPTTVVDAPCKRGGEGRRGAYSEKYTDNELGRDIASGLAAEGGEVGDRVHG